MSADAINAIHRVLGIYSHIIDNQRWNELDQVFTGDAVFHVVNTNSTMIGARGIGDRFSKIRHPLGHHFTNPVIDLAPDGKSAKVVIKLLVVRADGLSGTGSYEDEFVLTPAGWRISKRTARVRVAEEPGTSPATSRAARRPRLALLMPSAGLMVGEDHYRLIDIARQAEAAGVETLVFSDHVVMGERLDRYRWGPFAAERGKPWLEPLTLISAMAGATQRVRFMTGILIAPLRPAALLAKTVATLDQLSRGRIDLGVGTGWQPEEYESMGLDFDKRAQMLDDHVAACQALWGPSPASFTSPTVSFQNIWCDPKPWQHGGPPVYFSGPLTDRNLRRVVRMGRGWIPIMKAGVESVVADTTRLRAALAAANRDPDELRVRGTLPLAMKGDALDLPATLAGARRFAEGGITEVMLPMVALTPDFRQLPGRLDELTAAWNAVWS